jgi:hypothetical protein
MGAGFAPAFIILVPLAIWIYTLVFAFASLWFTHYGLAALQALRAEPLSAVASASPVVVPESTRRLNTSSVLHEASTRLPKEDL